MWPCCYCPFLCRSSYACYGKRTSPSSGRITRTLCWNPALSECPPRKMLRICTVLGPLLLSFNPFACILRSSLSRTLSLPAFMASSELPGPLTTRCPSAESCMTFLNDNYFKHGSYNFNPFLTLIQHLSDFYSLEPKIFNHFFLSQQPPINWIPHSYRLIAKQIIKKFDKLTHRSKELNK